MYYLGLKMFEATNILLAETRHMHQEMTFVLPVWKQECLCIVLVYNIKGSKCRFPQANIDKEDMGRTT